MVLQLQFQELDFLKELLTTHVKLRRLVCLAIILLPFETYFVVCLFLIAAFVSQNTCINREFLLLESFLISFSFPTCNYNSFLVTSPIGCNEKNSDKQLNKELLTSNEKQPAGTDELAKSLFACKNHKQERIQSEKYRKYTM